MGFRHALVDRARIIERRSLEAKIDGRKVYETTATAWFRARLTALQAPETTAGGRTRVPRTPELLYELRDEAGQVVALHADDRVEVDSGDLGHSIWGVNGEPEIMRRRSGVVGGLATLQRVEEHGPA